MDIRELLQNFDFEKIKNIPKEIDKELKKICVQGESGGGLVHISANGKGEFLSIAIDDSLIDLKEKQMLCDLVIAAANIVQKKVEENIQNIKFQHAAESLPTMIDES